MLVRKTKRAATKPESRVKREPDDGAQSSVAKANRASALAASAAPLFRCFAGAINAFAAVLLLLLFPIVVVLVVVAVAVYCCC